MRGKARSFSTAELNRNSFWNILSQFYTRQAYQYRRKEARRALDEKTPLILCISVAGLAMNLFCFSRMCDAHNQYVTFLIIKLLFPTNK